MAERPHGLLEIGHLRRAHGVRGQMNVQLATDRVERLEPGARWFARDTWLTVVSAEDPNGVELVLDHRRRLAPRAADAHPREAPRGPHVGAS